MVAVAASPLVEHGLDVVPVGIKHERRVVARVVLRAQAGGAVVRTAGPQRLAVERIHLRPAGGAEGDMRARRVRRGGRDPERAGRVVQRRQNRS